MPTSLSLTLLALTGSHSAGRVAGKVFVIILVLVVLRAIRSWSRR